MFHPVDHPMERGWVGRIEGDHVVHLAAQTLQSFFTGGGARDHAVYPLAAVRLLAPILRPPSIRAFDDAGSFEFRNPAAVLGPGTVVAPAKTPSDTLSLGSLELRPRLAAVVGAGGELAGFTLCADWRDTSARPPKDRDFALGVGPLVVTVDELPHPGDELVTRVDTDERLRVAPPPGFDWPEARDLAGRGTALLPGDLLLGPELGSVAVEPSRSVEIAFAPIGTLAHAVAEAGG
jgi:hypothetical protein